MSELFFFGNYDIKTTYYYIDVNVKSMIHKQSYSNRVCQPIFIYRGTYNYSFDSTAHTLTLDGNSYHVEYSFGTGTVKLPWGVNAYTCYIDSTK